MPVAISPASRSIILRRTRAYLPHLYLPTITSIPIRLEPLRSTFADPQPQTLEPPTHAIRVVSRPSSSTQSGGTTPWTL
jgi:hypothetical protein